MQLVFQPGRIFKGIKRYRVRIFQHSRQAIETILTFSPGQLMLSFVKYVSPPPSLPLADDKIRKPIWALQQDINTCKKWKGKPTPFAEVPTLISITN